MTITKDIQQSWLNLKASELVENLEGKGCDLVPCVECPFYVEHESQQSLSMNKLPDCMVQIMETNLAKMQEHPGDWVAAEYTGERQ